MEKAECDRLCEEKQTDAECGGGGIPISMKTMSKRASERRAASTASTPLCAYVTACPAAPNIRPKMRRLISLSSTTKQDMGRGFLLRPLPGRPPAPPATAEAAAAPGPAPPLRVRLFLPEPGRSPADDETPGSTTEGGSTRSHCGPDAPAVRRSSDPMGLKGCTSAADDDGTGGTSTGGGAAAVNGGGTIPDNVVGSTSEANGEAGPAPAPGTLSENGAIAEAPVPSGRNDGGGAEDGTGAAAADEVIHATTAP
jgi:hypothetical protein